MSVSHCWRTTLFGAVELAQEWTKDCLQPGENTISQSVAQVWSVICKSGAITLIVIAFQLNKSHVSASLCTKTKTPLQIPHLCHFITHWSSTEQFMTVLIADVSSVLLYVIKIRCMSNLDDVKAGKNRTWFYLHSSYPALGTAFLHNITCLI